MLPILQHQQRYTLHNFLIERCLRLRAHLQQPLQEPIILDQILHDEEIGGFVGGEFRLLLGVWEELDVFF